VPKAINVVVTNTAGDISVSGLVGSAWVNAEAGNVSLARLTGSLSVWDGAGNVSGRDVRSRAVNVTDGAGNVLLTFKAPPSRVKVRVSTGNIAVALPVPARYRVNTFDQLGTVTGNVPDSPASGRLISLGVGTGNISLTSSDRCEFGDCPRTAPGAAKATHAPARLVAVFVHRAAHPAPSTQLGAASAASRPGALQLKPCVVTGIQARCGTFVVPENGAKPDRHTIGLRVVVLPATSKPVAKDAVAYLAGGPGIGAASEYVGLQQAWPAVNAHHDILLVDQRGTGGSNAHACPNPTTPLSTPAALRAYTLACLNAFDGDMTQYGTRMAMTDLDAVRSALGYRQLDVFGASYGATAAQVYLKLYPSSVRTLILLGGSALDVPFFSRYAVNAQHALDYWAKLCASQSACRKAFPNWESQFGELVKAWDAHPVQIRKGVTMTGVQLASVVHSMLVDASKAPSIPLVVSSATKGDYGPLDRAGPGDMGASPLLMYWSIWCNEPWAGLGTKGPWGTDFDSYTTAFIGQFRWGCTFMPKRAEPRSFWTFASSKRVPVLAITGGADPQDPITNLPDLKRNFPDSRAVILANTAHELPLGGCIDQITASFIDRGTTKNLNTSCANTIAAPPFQLVG